MFQNKNAVSNHQTAHIYANMSFRSTDDELCCVICGV